MSRDTYRTGLLTTRKVFGSCTLICILKCAPLYASIIYRQKKETVENKQIKKITPFRGSLNGVGATHTESC